MERFEPERNGLERVLDSSGMLELRIRFSARKEPEKGWERGVGRDAGAVLGRVSGILSFVGEFESEGMSGGIGDTVKELNLVCSCFSWIGGGDKCWDLCIVGRSGEGRWDEGGMLVRREEANGEVVVTPSDGVYLEDAGRLVNDGRVVGCRALPVFVFDPRLPRWMLGPGLPDLCIWLSFFRHLARRFWNQT